MVCLICYYKYKFDFRQFIFTNRAGRLIFNIKLILFIYYQNFLLTINVHIFFFFILKKAPEEEVS